MEMWEECIKDGITSEDPVFQALKKLLENIFKYSKKNHDGYVHGPL